MVWNNSQIKSHRDANIILEKIKDEAFDYIRDNKNVSEYEVQQYILKLFKEYGLKKDQYTPIVGFNENSSIPHYFPKPKCKILKKNTVVLIDIWGRIKDKKSPYADITWMGYYGNVPNEVKKVFNIVITARNSCITYIKDCVKNGFIPTGEQVDNITTKIIKENGYEKYIKHRTGHSIGNTSPHGTYGHVSIRNKHSLKINLGYTIEPGIYTKKFGIRSEIDLYINSKKEVIITSCVQKKIVKI